MMIQNAFADYLRKMGKSEGTIKTYCQNIEQFFRWCRDSFGDKPQQLYRANVLDRDFMKVQIQYASPSTVGQKDVEAFRQRLLESGSKRDYAIVTLYTYSGIRHSECVNLRLDQTGDPNVAQSDIRPLHFGDKIIDI